MESHLAIKENEIMPLAATWTDLEIIILSEVSETKTNIMWYHLYVKMRNRLITIENKLTVPKGESHGGGVNREFGAEIHSLLYLKYVTNKDYTA